MSEWQPIETAPKDGTRLLVAFDNFEGAKKLCVARWTDGHWIVGVDLKSNSRMQMDRRPPTHWMSLPAPPDAHTITCSLPTLRQKASEPT